MANIIGDILALIRGNTASNINTFISNVKTDNLLSPTRFQVFIMGNANKAKNASQAIMINCATCQVPSLNITPIGDKRVGIGNLQHFAGDRELQPITLSFYESNSHKERQYFSAWIGQIYDIPTKRFSFFDDYKKTIIINALDKQNNIVYQCQLLGAFPTHVSEMNKSYSSIDTVDMMNISITYNEIQELFYPPLDNNLLTNILPTAITLLSTVKL
jgi:hypothetical protein